MSTTNATVPPGKKLGCLPRKTGFGQVCKPFREAIEVIPRSEWHKYIGGISLVEYVKQILDQDGVGSCAAEGTTQAEMIVEAWQGQPFTLLNPWSVYWYTSGGRDRGSSIDDNLDYLIQHGIAPDSVWPRSGHKWHEEPSQAAKEAAKAHRGFEWFDIGNEEEFGTALLKGFPVVFGTNYFGGGHALCAVELVSEDEFDFANSWDPTWGNNGFGTLRFRDIYWGYGAWALRASVGN